jgi:hypothetical protein
MHIHFVGFGFFAVTSFFFSFFFVLVSSLWRISYYFVGFGFFAVTSSFFVVSSLWSVSYSPLRFCIYLEDIAI